MNLRMTESCGLRYDCETSGQQHPSGIIAALTLLKKSAPVPGPVGKVAG